MKLYLSSYQFGNSSESLASLALPNKRIAVILNAADVYGDARRPETLKKNEAELIKLGFLPEDLDLRTYFGSPNELVKKLADFGAVWVIGGNAFVLRKAMAYSGFDREVKRRIIKGDLVYAGFSAGAVAVGPSLRGLEAVDDPTIVPEGYGNETLFDGLGLVNYAIAPHYKSDHPESKDIEKVVTYFRTNRIPHIGLRDGQAIVVNGPVVEIVG